MAVQEYAAPAAGEYLTPGRLLIGGQWVPAASERTFLTFDPATEMPLTSVARGDAEDVGRAVRAARRFLTG
jgi:aldehyde dehydrogenase (NAD+)